MFYCFFWFVGLEFGEEIYISIIDYIKGERWDLYFFDVL